MENKRNIRPISPFVSFCQKVIPLAYDESMSYYECLCALTNYLYNEVTPAVNNNADAVTELQTYVANYFKNLDVQEEINNKLDEMAKNGTLEEIITEYINLKSILAYDTVSEMKQATNLINGSFVTTYGFYNLNDGGGAKYKIRTITNDDVIDECFIIPLYDDTLIAELIIENGMLNMKQIGAKQNDNKFNNTTLLLKAIKKANDNELLTKIFYPAGTYTFLTSVDLENNELNLKSVEICGANTTEPGNNSATIFKYSGSNYFLNINDGFNAKIHDLYLRGNESNNGIYAENTFWTDFYNLYFIKFVNDMVLDGYNAYVHIYNNTFVPNTDGSIGVVIGGAESTYPRNYTEYIWVEKNHFEMGFKNTIGVKVYATFFLYILENDFSNTQGVAISLDARSTNVPHNIQDIFIESNSFAKCTTCVDIQGGIAGSSVAKIRIDGDYNNPLNRNGYKIVNAVRYAGYLGFVTITGMVTDYKANEKWISLTNCSNTDIDINNIDRRNVEVVSGSKPNFISKIPFDTNMIYKNVSGEVSASVSGNAITYDFSQAIADMDAGILIVSGAVEGTNSSCTFSAIINRGTRYGTILINGKGSNISSITTTGFALTVTCSSSYTPIAQVGNVKFTFLR